MKNKKYTNGLMMSIPSLYKAIAASETKVEVMNTFSITDISYVSKQRI